MDIVLGPVWLFLTGSDSLLMGANTTFHRFVPLLLPNTNAAATNQGIPESGIGLTEYAVPGASMIGPQCSGVCVHHASAAAAGAHA